MWMPVALWDRIPPRLRRAKPVKIRKTTKEDRHEIILDLGDHRHVGTGKQRTRRHLRLRLQRRGRRDRCVRGAARRDAESARAHASGQDGDADGGEPEPAPALRGLARETLYGARL